MVTATPLLALALTVSAPSEGPSITEQVLVLRAPRRTRLELKHLRGDRVASLTITRPPLDTLDTLRAQLGAHVVGVRRKSHVDGELRMMLDLSSESVRLRANRVRHAWAIRAKPATLDDIPSKSALSGRLPGLVDPPPLPVPVPPEPGDSPCPARAASTRLGWDRPAEHVEERFGDVQNPRCADHLAAALALDALRSGQDLAPFERWAFNFDPRHPWRDAPRAFAWVTQIAGEVLLRTGYHPEAEVALTSQAAFRLPSARPHQAASLANLAQVQGHHDDVAILVGGILPSAPESLRFAAAVVSFLAALSDGNPERSIEIALETRKRMERPEERSGAMFAFAAEVALGLDRLDTAERLYGFAVKGNDRRTAQLARIRLMDLSMRRGNEERARFRLAKASGWNPCIIAHLRLRSVLLGTDSLEKLERTLRQSVRRPACPSERREATFMLAKLHLDSGSAQRAVSLVVELDALLPPLLGAQRFAHALRDQVLTAAIARMVRHGQHLDLVRLYEERLKEHIPLDPASRLQIGLSHLEIGLPEKAQNVLGRLMAEPPPEPLREDVAHALLASYLGGGDDYRADLVLSYLEDEHPDSPRRWSVALGRAELELHLGRPDRSLDHSRSASVPNGDPTFQKLWLESRALGARGDAVGATRALIAALEVPFEPQIPSEGPIVERLSEALRTGNRRLVEPLWSAVLRRFGPDWPSERMKWHARRMGLPPEYEATPLVETLSAAANRRKPSEGSR
ncbi:MAG TPA: hypothetical protein RMG48_09750 [Myxococcales bacterium LLY-WYZ-16_1]|nr:hypothetical protein [Myxococcales bacterium LLY-WYZ-16_1]